MSEQSTAEPKILFRNPYAHLPAEQCSRLTVDVDTKDYNFIRSIRPFMHTNSGTVGLLWQKLCNKLREKGVQDVSDVAEFERFIAGCVIIDGEEYEQLKLDSLELGNYLAGRGGLSNRAASRPMPTTGGSNERTRAEGVRGKHASTETELPDVQGGSRKGGKGKRSRTEEKKS